MSKMIITMTTTLTMIAAPALAEQSATRTNIKPRGDTAAYVDYSSDAETITKKEVKRTVQKARDGVKRTADKLAETAKPSDAQLAAPGLAVEEAKIAQEHSAEHMIGKPVLNAAGERVGSVHDIIFSASGQAKNLIVADGGMMSLGDKKAAFDYHVMNGRDAKGALKTTITEEQINKAKDFSYETDGAASGDAKSGSVVKAADDLSLRDLIGAHVTDRAGKKIGTVKDVAIEGERAGKIIVAYDQILGVGGKKAGLSYTDGVFDRDDGGKLTLRLNEAQAAKLANAGRAR